MNNEPTNNASQDQLGGHDVALTPPPPTDATSVSGAPLPERPVPSASRGSGARAGVIAIAAFGGIALIGAGGTAAFAAVHDIQTSVAGAGEVQSVSVAGVDAISVDVAASDVTVRFGNVDEATLEVTGTVDNRWTMERIADELVVGNDESLFGWFGGDWFGSRWFANDESVVLTLPDSLNDANVDANFSLGAGSLDVDGEFGQLDIDLGAGSLNLTGSATSVVADISAGRADLYLTGLTEADFQVSAGKLVTELTGTAPRLITIDVSAGSADLTVPDDVYDVSQEVSAGSLDNRLDTSSSSRNRIDATLSAGSAVIRPGD